MAGKGPAPKEPSRRARRNSEPTPLRVVVAEPVPQPDLPTFEIEEDGELIEFVWPARTKEWWRMWKESPLSADFTSTDWSELLDTALLHARYWKGQVTLAAEIRLRVAKFGATPEDRARLRITFAAAADAEERRGPSGKSARDRRSGTRRVA
jgi:hypothetical protein